MKPTGLNGYVYDFLVSFGSIDVDDNLYIHKYLMNKYKIMLGLIKHLLKKHLLLSFNVSLGSIVNASDHTKCISLNNQQCMNQPTIINLNSDE